MLFVYVRFLGQVKPDLFLSVNWNMSMTQFKMSCSYLSKTVFDSLRRKQQLNTIQVIKLNCKKGRALYDLLTEEYIVKSVRKTKDTLFTIIVHL